MRGNGNSGLRIMVIDDNPAIHQDFKKILTVEQPNAKLSQLNELLFGKSFKTSKIEFPAFQIDIASQGKEGVEQIEQALTEGNPYALAFVDIRMPPGWDGIETIQHIWALDKDIQIVICTAYSDYSWEETISKLGMTDSLLILKKPFDSVAVRQLAYALTKKWELMQDNKVHLHVLEQKVEDRTLLLQKSLSLLEHQATHDSLTTLPNRMLLLERINHAIAHVKRTEGVFAIIFVDLDRFKLVNDSFSHEAGDVLLKTISERLKKITRAEDTIARLSGDEFIFVFMPESLKQSEAIMNIAERILEIMSESISIDNHEIFITASMGISMYPQDGTNAEELIRNADLAMYNAKALGGNQYQFYTSVLNHQSRKRLDRESELRKALLANEFYIEYQPQYDLSAEKLIAVEALIRWQHPTEGILLPMEFIPLAEDTGLIVPIGEWVLRTACRQNKAWQDKGLPPIIIAVNVATKQFMQPDFIQTVKKILDETGLLPQYLEIEVTENVIINNISVIETIKELKNLGIKIVLDDFGTGNSSLNYLRALPIDQLKIDQSFIHEIDENQSDAIIVRAIISIANSLSFEVVAEGVENSLQVNFLKQEHCDKLQGYYFSRPVDAKTLESLLKEKFKK